MRLESLIQRLLGMQSDRRTPVISSWRTPFQTALPFQVARFGAVGLTATVTHYLVAASLAALVSAYAANLGGFLAAVGLSYHGHKHWTFRGRIAASSSTGQLLRFVVVSLSALGLSEFALHFGLTFLALSPLPALLLAVLTVPPVTFIAAKLWVFRAAH